jgi:hypothetical protein
MALGQRFGDAIDHNVVIQQRIDPSEGGIPELVGERSSTTNCAFGRDSGGAGRKNSGQPPPIRTGK